jgi:hypothetical protein
MWLANSFVIIICLIANYTLYGVRREYVQLIILNRFDQQDDIPTRNLRAPYLTIKVRNVARLIYKRIIRAIGLNVVYLLMFNNDSTMHV